MCSQFGQVQLQRLREHCGQAGGYQLQRLREHCGHWAHEVQAGEYQQHGAASDVELKELVVDQCDQALI